MQYGKSKIIERLEQGKELGYSDLEKMPSGVLSDVILAFDTVLWERGKGAEYRKALKDVGEHLEMYWEED